MVNYKKKYIELKNSIERLYHNVTPLWKGAIESYIPELKESDDKKRSEQKPAEPKFNVGDKIRYSKGCGTIVAIEKIKEDEYIFADNMGHISIEEGNKWYLVEQKPANKVEPKFKIGDCIERKDGLGCHAKIIFIGGNVYGCEKLIYSADEFPFFEFMFKNQDEFQISSDFKQKPAYDVKPKFHEGDWVFIEEVRGHKNGPFQIKTVDSFGYSFDEYHTIPFMHEDLLSKWTIKDAKDGDVLAVNNEVFIYAHRKQMYSIAVAHCFVDSAGGFYFDGEFGYTEKGNSIHPATKEQRDLLFQKIKESGYEWDDEKKKLKKIEQLTKFEEAIKDLMNDYRDAIGDNDATIEEIKKHSEYLISLIPQKAAEWSEEDERIYRSIMYSFAHNYPLTIQQQEFVKSLKDKYLGSL